MFFSYCLLALCVSIDSLGIGITYGLKNTNISNLAKLILFMFSIFVTTLSLFLGNIIKSVFPNYISSFIGCLLLCLMGAWIIFQSLKNDRNYKDITNLNFDKKNITQFFIKSLGITVQIIRNPNYSDLDNSNNIDCKEAFFLAIALSLDSIGVGIGSSIIGINSLLFPILVSSFQLVFLSIGKLLGLRIKDISNIPDNIWSIISGLLLIFMGIGKLIF